jgi:stage V sporulation protein B
MELKTSIFVPLGASVFMGILCWGTYYLVHLATQSNIFGFLVAFVIAVITYFIAIFLLNGISEEELSSVPKGQVLVRLAKKLHLLH